MNFVQQRSDRKKKVTKKIKQENDSVFYIHTNKMKYFEELQNIILPKKKEELEKLEILYKKNIPNSKISNKINILKNEIKDINSKKEENNYFLDTISIYQEYIDLLESSKTNMGNNNDFTTKKKDIINRYYIALGIASNYTYEDSHINIYDCSFCNNSNCVIESIDCFSCKLCGVLSNTQTYPVELSYQEKKEKEPTSNNIGYKRVNYLIECLTQMQAKETFFIPEHVIDKVLLELKKEKITDIVKLNYKDIRRYLKKTGCSKFYEHSPLILTSITGIYPPQIPKQIEEKLIWMFKEIQQPYEHFKPANRTSFFNYPYIINKLLQLLGLEEYRMYFKMLEDRQKLYLQDVTWEKVAEYLRANKSHDDSYDIPWRFIRSL
jgi:hypothetical protein